MGAQLIDEESVDQYNVTEPACKIGSAPTNDIVITAKDVAPVHVRMEKRGDEWWVAIMAGAPLTVKSNMFLTAPSASLNKKGLDGKLVKINSGDKLQIGSRLFMFRVS